MCNCEYYVGVPVSEGSKSGFSENSEQGEESLDFFICCKNKLLFDKN
jgi:hypothetical protein